MLNLRYIDKATDEDRRDELDAWARLFKVDTWEELKNMAEQYEFAKEAATSIYAVSADEAIKLQCEARERNQRDMLGSYRAGVRHEQANTEREKGRANAEKERADDATKRANAEKERADAAEKRAEAAEAELRELRAKIASVS